MDRITAKTTSKDVQAAAGHDRTHWRRFLTITMQLGTALIAADPSISSWRNVPNPNQQALRKAVDDKLRQEEIPPVNVKVIDWRMAQVIKDTLKKNIRNQPALSPTSQEEAESSHKQTEGEAYPSTPNSSSSNGRSGQYYDPVRGSMRKSP